MHGGSKRQIVYYGCKGKFCRFTLAGGLVHQAITVSTHSTMNTHDFLIFTIWCAVPSL
jgi:hypothetical protein